MKLTFRMRLRVQDMAKNNLLQSYCYEPDGNKWYMSQARDCGANDLQHTYVRRFSSTGAYEGYMKMTKWGHGSHMGVRRSELGNVRIWLPLDSYTSSGRTSSTRASRIIFERSTTKGKSSDGVQLFEGDYGDGGFSLWNGWLYMRDPHAHSETYRKFNEQEYLAHSKNEPKVYDKLECTKRGRPGPFQGCAARDDELVIISGTTNKTFCLEKYSWSANKRIKRYSIPSSYVKDKLRGHVATVSSVEPEGLFYMPDGQLTMGIRSGPANNKRNFSVMDVTWGPRD